MEALAAELFPGETGSIKLYSYDLILRCLLCVPLKE
ncbi:hypothetical protein EYZ11_011494 [Aspergillus tanneri]|uniref:Uncharacterized protein n=1 Tax=Aspergillus tanneri TaxID=1220188 RepID=A0A4V3UMX8_9EURO|nr:hypothetical protein EYZ11_011494 [Aspergillus tanneri]